MIMMTDPERRNSEPFKSGILSQHTKNSPENVKHYSFEDLSYRQSRCLPSAYVSCQQVVENGQAPREKLVLSLDDGYGTDSRSNTTASISSPLSSSLSSLSTFEGSPIGTGGNILTLPHQDLSSAGHFAMQRGPIEKGPSVLAMSRSSMNKHMALHVKRRDAQAESPETTTNLEDRLRALTTIEEEEIGFHDRNRGRFVPGNYVGDTLVRLSHSFASSPRDLRHNNRNAENPEFGQASSYDAPGLNTSGYFRAVPVQVNEAHARQGDRQEMRSMSHDAFRPHSTSPLVNGDGWKDYSTFFQKDNEIPLHNIDPAGRGKFTNASVDDVPDMDINRQIGMGTPNTIKKQLRFSHDVDHAKRITDQSKAVSPSPVLYRAMGVDDSAQYQQHHHPMNKGPSGNSVNGIGNNSRQRRIMSSMPDLRAYQPSSWHSEHTPSSLPYQPSSYTPSHQEHHYPQQYDWYKQDEEQPSEHEEPRYQHSFQMQQKPDPPSHYQQQQPHWQPLSQTNRYVNLQPQYASAIDVSNTGNFVRDSPYGVVENHADFDNPEVVLRRTRPLVSPRTAPPRLDRYSWQPENLSSNDPYSDLENRMRNVPERSSLDLGSIPQLQRQIRATSELCLQASRRHMFASSADIYKLFSGQNKPTVLSSPGIQRHSLATDQGGANSVSKEFFNQTPGGHGIDSTNPCQQDVIPGQSPNLPRTKPKLRVVMPPSSIVGLTSSPGPVRANHQLHIPPESWINVTSLPYDARCDMDAAKLQRQSQSFSARGDFASYQRPPSTDLGADKPLYQRPHSVDLGMDKPFYQRPPSVDLGMDKPLYQRPPSVDLGMDKPLFQRPPSVDQGIDKQFYQRPPSADLGADKPLYQRPHSVDLGMDKPFYQRPPIADLGMDKPLYHKPHISDTGIDKPLYQRIHSSDVGLDKPQSQRPITSDQGLDKPMFHRQSSGYSSETELQQIEFNAVKRSKQRQGKQQHKDHNSQEFVPLNSSMDSNICTDQTDEHTEEEPVYVNLASAKTLDVLNRQSSSGWLTPQSAGEAIGNTFQAGNVHPSSAAARPPTRDQYGIRPVDYSSKEMYPSADGSQHTHLKYSEAAPYYHSNQDTNPYSNAPLRLANENAVFPDTAITQKQVINFKKKPLTITSLVPQFAYEDIRSGEAHANNFSASARPNYPLTPHVSVLHDYPVSPPYHSDQHADESRSYDKSRQTATAIYNNVPDSGHSSVHTGRQLGPGGSSTMQLSPAVIAQMLDTPFATNIISDEQGDKLSTLV